MTKRNNTIDVFDQLTDEDHGEPGEEQDAELSAGPTDTDTADPGIATREQDEHGPAPTAASRGGRRHRQLTAAVVGVLLLASLGSAAYLGWRFKQLDDTAAAARAAVSAARDYAEVLTTMDSTDIDEHYTAALDGATGRFKDEYSQGAAQLRQVLIDNQAAGRGTVIDAAVKSATPTEVEVLLFVDQSITNVVNPSPRIDHNRLQMTMKLVDGRWLASSVEIL